MGLCSYWVYYKTKIIHKHESAKNNLMIQHKKIQGINPMGLCDPYADYKNNNTSQPIKQNKQPWDVTKNIYKELLQWAFVLLGRTLT